MNFTRAASFSERNSRIVRSWFSGKDVVCIDAKDVIELGSNGHGGSKEKEIATVIIDRDATRACHVSAFGTGGCPGLWASLNHGENSSQLSLL